MPTHKTSVVANSTKPARLSAFMWGKNVFSQQSWKRY